MPRQHLTRGAAWALRHWHGLALGFAAFVLVYALTLHLFDGWKHDVQALMGWGGWPMFLLFTVLYNVLLVPFPYEPFLLAALWLLPEMSVEMIGVLATLGLTVAAVIDWLLGRWLAQHVRPLLERIKGYGRCEASVQKYGVWAVGASAITPLPFSLVCWVAGLAGVRLWSLTLMVLVTRAARCAAVLWLLGGSDSLLF